MPESEVGVFGDVSGLDAVELGCGTAYFSAWLARMGARVVGVDPTPAQLDTARRMQAEFGLDFPLIQAFGEAVPLPDASFDLVHSEYGASLWADPYRWIPEAARLLRPGGRLVFLRGSTLAMLCFPDVGKIDEQLHRPQFGMFRLYWPESEGAVEYHLPTGELFDLLRANGARPELERKAGKKKMLDCFFDGMGEPLYEAVWAMEGVPCRIYAPVGGHRELLAYLVRRLLENGANSSFVAIAGDRTVPVDFASHAAGVGPRRRSTGAACRGYRCRQDLYVPARRNSKGMEFGDRRDLDSAPCRDGQGAGSGARLPADGGESRQGRGPVGNESGRRKDDCRQRPRVAG